MHIVASDFALWARSVEAERDAVGSEIEGSEAVKDPHTWLQNVALAITVGSMLLALIVCALRAYIRVKMRGLAVDDWLIFSAMGFSILLSAFSWLFIKAAYIGIHDIDVPKDLSPTAGLEWNFGAGLSYRPILGLAKMSALFFLLRLGQHSNRLVLFIWTQIWLNVAFSLSILLMFIFGCDPISHNWDMSSLGMQCFNGRYYALYSSVSTIFTDFLVLMVPFWILKDIRLAFKVKAAILAIFLLGLLVTAFGTARLYFILAAYWFPKPRPDKHFAIGYTVMIAESNLAIITASAPALWPLARRWWPSLFAGLRLSHGYQGQLQTIAARSDDTGDVETGVKRPRRCFKRRLWRSCAEPQRNDREMENRWGTNHFLSDRTIGGTSVVSKNALGLQRATTRTSVLGRSSPDSDFSDLSKDSQPGILWTRDVTVEHEQVEPPQTPRPTTAKTYPRRKDLSQITGLQ